MVGGWRFSGANWQFQGGFDVSKCPNFRLRYREVSTLEDSTTTLEYGFAEVSGSQGEQQMLWVVFFVHVV